MTVYDVIDRKKRGFALTEGGIRFFVQAAALGRAREGFSVEGAPPVRQPLVYCTIEKEDD